MEIVFHRDFYRSDYASDQAAAPGRMESIVSALEEESGLEFLVPSPAREEDLARVHTRQYLDTIKADKNLYGMACLAAGGAILASERARHGMPAFAVVRPPGHHASRDSGWGYCYLCNIAVALKKLFAGGRISSAFVLDFDAHTGDGTRDCLADLAGVQVFNPMAETAGQYHREIESCLQTIKNADIIAVSAGFDAYVKDTGGKLDTFDFYRIGNALRLLCRRLGHNRRFAVLEGGYYHPDLGKNVLAFCQGFG